MVRFAIIAFLASVILAAIAAAAPSRSPAPRISVERNLAPAAPTLAQPTIRRISNPGYAGTNFRATPLLQ